MKRYALDSHDGPSYTLDAQTDSEAKSEAQDIVQRNRIRGAELWELTHDVCIASYKYTPGT